MRMEDKELLDKFCIERNLKLQTRKSYSTAIKIYTEFQQKSMHNLILEAEEEEKNRIQWKYAKLRERLINFRNHLLEQELLYASIKSYISRITTIYENFEIEIGKLPRLSNKNVRKSDAISFSDLPEKVLIKQILKTVNPVMRAIILFMTSSGCAKRETLNITIKDFIKSTYNYHHEEDIYKVIDILRQRNDVVPSWRLKRQKTNKYYTTFSSPESTSEIINYLIADERVLKLDSPLFKITPTYFNNYFTKINNKFNLGKAGTYNKFRSHVLRKWQASHLYNDGMSMDEIDELQGRGKDPTRTSYFLEDPLRLRDKYIEHMGCLTINMDVNTLDLKSPEYAQLETRLENKEVEVAELKQTYELTIEDILKRVDSLEQKEISKNTLMRYKQK